MTVISDALILFRTPFEREGGTKVDSMAEEKAKQKPSTDEEYILCRQCLQVITSPAERIKIQGTHQHTFANLHGIVFEIGCFRSAIGCIQTGSTTDEWTWFKGFNWKVALCGVCLVHMGWLYPSRDGFSFYGLILDRIIESKETSP